MQQRDNIRKMTDDAAPAPAPAPAAKKICPEPARQRANVIFSILACDYADEDVFAKIRCICRDGRAACYHPSLHARALIRTHAHTRAATDDTSKKMLFVRAAKKGEDVFIETMRAYGIDNLYRDGKIFSKHVRDAKIRYKGLTPDSCLHIAVACRFWGRALRWILAIPNIDVDAHVHITRAYGPYYDIYALLSLIPCDFAFAQLGTFKLTPVHIAAGIDNCEALKMLAAAGANLSAFSNDANYSCTPLHTAVENWNEHAIACLIDELRVDPNVRFESDFGYSAWTPLDYFMLLAYVKWKPRVACTGRTLLALLHRGALLGRVDRADLALACFLNDLQSNNDDLPFSSYREFFRKHNFRWHYQKLMSESDWCSEEDVSLYVRTLLCCAVR